VTLQSGTPLTISSGIDRNLDGLTAEPSPAEPSGQSGGLLWSRPDLERSRHNRADLHVPF